MIFADAFGELFDNHRAFYDQLNAECPRMLPATRTAQAWWLEKTEVLPESNPPLGLLSRPDARKFYGAEYGAAVLPSLIGPPPSCGGVRFHWLLSTWQPYRVVVMRTDFEP